MEAEGAEAEAEGDWNPLRCSAAPQPRPLSVVLTEQGLRTPSAVSDDPRSLRDGPHPLLRSPLRVPTPASPCWGLGPGDQAEREGAQDAPEPSARNPGAPPFSLPRSQEEGRAAWTPPAPPEPLSVPQETPASSR